MNELRLRDIYESVVVHANDAILVCRAETPDDTDGPRIVYANPAFTTMTGYSAAEIVGRTHRLLQSPRTDRAERDRVRESMKRLEPTVAELMNVRKDGVEFWVQISIVPVSDATGTVTHWISIQRDVTARKRRELAVADMLEGLTDLVLVLDHTGVVVSSEAASDDTLGAPSRTPVGQDFVALVHPDDVEIASALVTPVHGMRVSAGAAAEVRIRHTDDKWRWYRVSVTDLGSRDDGGPVSVLSCVDITSTHRTATIRKSRSHNDIRLALDHGDIGLHYQPVVDLHSGDVVGLEALARWNHPTRGTVMPGEFIDRAEATGLMNELGEWVLTSALREAARRRGHPGGEQSMVWVNMSTSQIRNPEVVPLVERLLAEAGVPGAALGLEITENVLMSDTTRARSTLRRLRNLGIGLAIDDFGTGYSSLSYLAELPIDTIKIDRTFVHGLGTDRSGRESAAIIRAVLGMASALDLDVVAEGIETSDQLNALRELGCRRGQGVYLGPASVDGAVVRRPS